MLPHYPFIRISRWPRYHSGRGKIKSTSHENFQSNRFASSRGAKAPMASIRLYSETILLSGITHLAKWFAFFSFAAAGPGADGETGNLEVSIKIDNQVNWRNKNVNQISELRLEIRWGFVGKVVLLWRESCLLVSLL